MFRASRLLPVLVLPVLLITACGPTTGESTGSTSTATPTPTEARFDLAGIWTDTDVVGENSCGLPQPAPGSSRVTEGIVVTHEGDAVTMTPPVNIVGTQPVTSGTLADDGSLVLTGSDGGATTTLTLQAISDTELTGSSQVDTGTCVFTFTNSMVKTAED